MRPVATVADMRAADQAALEQVPEEVLVRRAGTAVASVARNMLGQTYGRRVVVVAGRGNNGADGRVAAALLRRRGAHVLVVDPPAAEESGVLPPCELVIDAAYGTGFRGEYRAPTVAPGTPVLAVDIPSGVHGDTGEAAGDPVRATRTVSMAALKPGLLQGAGFDCSGEVEVAEIGIPVPNPSIVLMEDADAHLLPRPERDVHKWSSAVAIVAGSPGMEGAAALASRGAARAGAGMVRLCVPGSDLGDGATLPGPWPVEAVRIPIPRAGWAGAVLEVAERCKALVIGPGLGLSETTSAAVREVIARSPVPVVADADALSALGDTARIAELAAGRPMVVTPHAGEYNRLAGHPPGSDRVAAACELAERSGVVALVKGSLTAVALPPGERTASGPNVLLAAAGSPRLGTAGTGDVLSGIIGAFMARGMDPGTAAALAAHVHGRAASLAPGLGLVAGDLPDLVLAWLAGQGAA